MRKQPFTSQFWLLFVSKLIGIVALLAIPFLFAVSYYENIAIETPHILMIVGSLVISALSFTYHFITLNKIKAIFETTKQTISADVVSFSELKNAFSLKIKYEFHGKEYKRTYYLPKTLKTNKKSGYIHTIANSKQLSIDVPVDRPDFPFINEIIGN